MDIILYDGIERNSLLPFTYMRAVADIRIGILTLREKWEAMLSREIGIFAYPYLQPKYSYTINPGTYFVNASYLPDMQFLDALSRLKVDESLVIGKDVAAFRTSTPISTLNHLNMVAKTLHKVSYSGKLTYLKFPWDIFTYNGSEITKDIERLRLTPNGDTLDSSNKVIAPEHVYVQKGAKATCSIINASQGPIYLGPESELMEGSIVKGAFALGDHATVKMGAKIYGDTTIGPYCKVGGEVSNTVFLGYANKGHDGYIGNAVIGEWCNLGADTNCSNLKNNYSKVKVWHYPDGKAIDTGLQFCGLLMGDHSKCGINTMFNTGTVIGVSANIYGGDFPPKFIPSFAWGSVHDGWQEFDIKKALMVAQNMMERRNISLTDIDKQIFWQIHEDSMVFRNQLIQGHIHEK